MLDVLAGGGARRTATIDRRVATIDSVGPQVLFRRLQEPRFVTGCAGSRRCSACLNDPDARLLAELRLRFLDSARR